MIRMTLDELRTMVDMIDNQATSGNMKEYVNVSIKKNPDDTEYIEFEQPNDWTECNSKYYRYTESKQE